MVIGNEVADVYDAVLKEGGGEVPDDYGEDDNSSFADKAVSLISGIFTDILASLSAGGIIKGCRGYELAFNKIRRISNFVRNR